MMKAELPGVSIVVPAAGRGIRMLGETPKQFIELNGKPVLQHTLEKLGSLGPDRMVVVVPPRGSPGFLQGYETVAGGSTRAQSVLYGIEYLEAAPDGWLMVHDGVRPCVRPADVMQLYESVSGYEAGGLLAVPLVDTVKIHGPQGRVLGTQPRDGLWLAQTPQMFRCALLKEALCSALDEGIEITDESAAMERLGHQPLLVEGHRDNLKITRQEDLALAGFYLQRQERKQ